MTNINNSPSSEDAQIYAFMSDCLGISMATIQAALEGGPEEKATAAEAAMRAITRDYGEEHAAMVRQVADNLGNG